MRWRAIMREEWRRTKYVYLMPVGIAVLAILPTVVMWAKAGGPEGFTMPMFLVAIGVAIIVRVRNWQRYGV